MGSLRSHQGSSGDSPSPDKTFDLGLLKVTLHEVGNLYFESAIQVRIDSDRRSLVEPVPGQFGPEPSAADKLIVVLKAALRKEGLTILEEGGNNPLPPGQAPSNSKKVSLRNFTSYKPESEGVRIRAESGYYSGTFNSHVMAEIAGNVLAELAPNFRKAITIDGVERRMNDIYDAVDMRGQEVGDAMREADEPPPRRASPSSAPPAAELALRSAISRKIPESLLSGEPRNTVIATITIKTMGDVAGRWAPAEKSKRGTEEDATFMGIKQLLAGHMPGKSDAVVGFVAGEVCDAVYAAHDKKHGVTTGDDSPSL